VDTEARDPGDPRILDSAVIGPVLPRLVGLQDDPAAFHRDRHALVEEDLGEPDAGLVAPRDDPRQQVQPAVGTVAAGRVEDPFGLLGGSGSGTITVPTLVSR